MKKSYTYIYFSAYSPRQPQWRLEFELEEDGLHDGQHHGRRRRVGDPHGQEGGRHHETDHDSVFTYSFITIMIIIIIIIIIILLLGVGTLQNCDFSKMRLGRTFECLGNYDF